MNVFISTFNLSTDVHSGNWQISFEGVELIFSYLGSTFRISNGADAYSISRAWAVARKSCGQLVVAVIDHPI